MENKNIPVEQAPENSIGKEIVRIAINEYGIIPIIGVCSCIVVGAGIGGLIGIKLCIK